jgi:hypothetical protein
MREAKIAPRSWAIMYRNPLSKSICPVIIVAMVTVGVTWPPETLAIAKTVKKGQRDVSNWRKERGAVLLAAGKLHFVTAGKKRFVTPGKHAW